MSLLMWAAVGLVGLYAGYKLVVEPWMNDESKKIATKYNTDPSYKKQLDSVLNNISSQLKNQKPKANYSSLYTGGKKISY